jgi:hypothetical protein
MVYVAVKVRYYSTTTRFSCGKAPFDKSYSELAELLRAAPPTAMPVRVFIISIVKLQRLLKIASPRSHELRTGTLKGLNF